MTEKRFQYNVNKNSIEENGKFVAYVNSVDGVRIANKLNILQKENEQLKSTVEEMIKIFNDSGLDYVVSDEIGEILND